MRQTIFGKLTASFFVFSALIISIMWGISARTFDREFENYLSEVNRLEINELFDEVESVYREGSGFSQPELRDIRRDFNRSGYSVVIEDADGKIILETSGEHGGIESEEDRVEDVGEGEKLEFELDMGTGTGKVTVGFKSSNSLEAEGLVFRDAIRKAIGFGSIALLVASLAIGYALSRKISRPVMSIKLVAERIRDGEWSHRYISSKSDPKEIYELSESIDQMAKSLKAQEELRKRLVSDMAHELRTPIAVLKSHLEAMIEGVWEPGVERLKELYAETDMINELVDRLKDIHTLEAAGQTLELERVDLGAELECVSNPLVPMFYEKGIVLSMELEHGVEVKLDRRKFKQIVYNLLLNSYKYSDSNSRVVLKLESLDSGVEVTVSDSGVGISEEDLPHVFERFYRGEKSRNRDYGGTGLGLTIVKALVEAQGWKIGAKSELGVGSEFKISIPKKNLKYS